jgi:hypothetical protein
LSFTVEKSLHSTQAEDETSSVEATPYATFRLQSHEREAKKRFLRLSFSSPHRREKTSVTDQSEWSTAPLSWRGEKERSFFTSAISSFILEGMVQIRSSLGIDLIKKPATVQKDQT